MNQTDRNRSRVQPSPSNRGKRHDPGTIELARIMADGGWTAHEIQQYLTGNGTSVAWATVKSWIDPEYRQVRNRVTIEDKRRSRDVSGDHVKRRMLELADRGLSDKAISVVVELYHGRSISPGMVREYRRQAAEHQAIAEGSS